MGLDLMVRAHLNKNFLNGENTMLKKSIEYTDYNDITRTEDFYFNLSKSEILELDLRTPGGLKNNIEIMASKSDGDEIMTFFKDLLFRSYGEKSADGKFFIKSDQLSISFSQTNAYDVLFVELVTDPEKAAKFFNEIIPNIPTTETEKE